MAMPTGHFETVPYDDRTIRSIYHIREYDVARLLQVCHAGFVSLLHSLIPRSTQLKNRGSGIDVFLSHDWPLGIEQHGDVDWLKREKPFFREEVRLLRPPLLLTRC